MQPDPARLRQLRAWRVLLASGAYVVIGRVPPAVSSPVAVKEWRLAAWMLGLAVFTMHFVVVRRGRGGRARDAAEVAFAVALGAFALAALGPFRAHWAEPGRARLAVLSLLAWPVLTGLPAFAVAMLGGVVLDRASGRTYPSRGQ